MSRETTQALDDSAGQSGGLELSAFTDIRPLYFLPADPLAEEVLIPCFRVSCSLDFMVGYFSSTVLSEIAPGLASFIANTEETFRLIISPYLNEDDKRAIEEGVHSVEEVATDLLNGFFVTEDALERHALNCLTHLLRVGRIDIRVAIMKDALFHPKVWIFERGEEALAAHGSSNLTSSGIRRNFEQINVSRSWKDGTQSYIVEKFKYQFERLWANREDDCMVVDLPKAVKNHLLCDYGRGAPPSEDEFIELYRKASGRSEQVIYSCAEPTIPQKQEFTIPEWLRYEDGPFAHQGNAVSTPTKNPHCTRHSHPPRPAALRITSSGATPPNMGPGSISPNANSSISPDNSSLGAPPIRQLWRPRSRRGKQHETASA